MDAYLRSWGSKEQQAKPFFTSSQSHQRTLVIISSAAVRSSATLINKGEFLLWHQLITKVSQWQQQVSSHYVVEQLSRPFCPTFFNFSLTAWKRSRGAIHPELYGNMKTFTGVPGWIQGTAGATRSSLTPRRTLQRHTHRDRNTRTHAHTHGRT